MVIFSFAADELCELCYTLLFLSKPLFLQLYTVEIMDYSCICCEHQGC